MLKKLKRFLVSRIKRLGIVDALLFGSAVKGKVLPGDIDVCLIFRNKVSLEVVDKLAKEAKSKGFNLHISTLTIDNFFTKPHSLIRTLLKEGISISTGRKFSENFNLKSFTLYSYTLKKIKPSSKVRFVYLLKGRGKESGFVKRLNGKWINDGCFIIPIEKDNEILEVMKRWKINYKREVLLLIS
ncbi:hypothetical protein B6U80_01135 [Candidatus Pacearchaeota archaeon ex4484_26]|nr:MAG: hypothetical protein B6U80_01135 [Candidatus Pacearchaeota archaeon ex4484_26]